MLFTKQTFVSNTNISKGEKLKSVIGSGLTTIFIVVSSVQAESVVTVNVIGNAPPVGKV